MDWHRGPDAPLAGEREPWLPIDPEPLIGDAGFDLWPTLDSGWSSDPTRADAPGSSGSAAAGLLDDALARRAQGTHSVDQ